MKTRDVLLAILIIAFGLSIKYAKSLKDEISSIFSEKETFDFEEEILTDGKEWIQIEGKKLNIVVEGWEGEKIEGKLIKSVASSSKEDAEELAKVIRVEKEEGENYVRFKIKNVFKWDFNFFNFRFPVSELILIRIKIPLRSSLKIISEHSDIEISGSKASSEIENTHGDIKIMDCEGSFSIKNSHGNVEVRNLNGDIKIFSPHSSVNIEGASNAEIETSFEDIFIKNLKNLKLITKHSPVEISGVEGEIYIKNTHSQVSIKDSSLKGAIEGEHLEIDGEGIVAGELEIRSSYEPIILKRFSGKGKIHSKHSEIGVDVGRGSDLEIECEYSDITLDLDKEWKGAIFLEVYRGEVEASNLPLELEGKGMRKMFKSNLGGNNFLSVKTTYGKILINREGY